jgi:hypothetical protein
MSLKYVKIQNFEITYGSLEQPQIKGTVERQSVVGRIFSCMLSSNDSLHGEARRNYTC